MGKRGRSAGFYCSHCDLTFKDSLQWIDHQNSKQHLAAIGAKAEVKVATLEDVLQRIEWLKRQKQEREKGLQMDLKQRLEDDRRREEEERRERRERRKAARQRKKSGVVKSESGESKDMEKMQVDEEEDADTIAMARMMGFGGFGSSKKG